jgi:hypothetical protein
MSERRRILKTLSDLYDESPRTGLSIRGVVAGLRLFHPTPKPLIKDGELQHANMRRELVTEEELIGKLRRQGVTETGRGAAPRMARFTARTRPA